MNWLLMENNIPKGDLNDLCEFIQNTSMLTNSKKVLEFEKAWSEWLGVKHSVYVNSGASANLLSLLLLKHKLISDGYDENDLGDVIVSTLNWVTDISSVMLCGFRPVFVDINQTNLCMDEQEVMAKCSSKTRAVLLTHLMGFNGLTTDLLEFITARDIFLIEDCCESHGAEFDGVKVGTKGDVSNFSFYYGHHITTIEGGMVCTNSDGLYQLLRMLRSHGLVRECTDQSMKDYYLNLNPEPAPEFVFAYPGFNFRGTEIGAFLGELQLARLDHYIKIRKKNFDVFLSALDPEIFFTDFSVEGNSNFGLPLILNEKAIGLMNKVIMVLEKNKVVFRRGVAGGGNQLRQPYLRNKNYGVPEDFPRTDHIHYFALYIGNHQYVKHEDIIELCGKLNHIR
jgi:CDP-4-dehydro-6-deoxyglucose reductase, E1